MARKKLGEMTKGTTRKAGLVTALTTLVTLWGPEMNLSGEVVTKIVETIAILAGLATLYGLRNAIDKMGK